MLETIDIKQVLYDMGVDLCGVASVDRFEEAPEGFHPHDLLPTCKSVIVFAKEMHAGTLHSGTTIPYTITRNMLIHELDVISVRFCGVMAKSGIIAVPTGTISPGRFDHKTGRWRGAISAKHSAAAAGLGWIGKNTLLVTPEYGNMVWLSAVLLDTELEPDPMQSESLCKDDCMLCTDNCPANALGNPEMNQSACRSFVFREVEGDDLTFKCYRCRTICPYCYGSKNTFIKPGAV